LILMRLLAGNSSVATLKRARGSGLLGILFGNSVSSGHGPKTILDEADSKVSVEVTLENNQAAHRPRPRASSRQRETGFFGEQGARSMTLPRKGIFTNRRRASIVRRLVDLGEPSRSPQHAGGDETSTQSAWPGQRAPSARHALPAHSRADQALVPGEHSSDRPVCRSAIGGELNLLGDTADRIAIEARMRAACFPCRRRLCVTVRLVTLGLLSLAVDTPPSFGLWYCSHKRRSPTS